MFIICFVLLVRGGTQRRSGLQDLLQPRKRSTRLLEKNSVCVARRKTARNLGCLFRAFASRGGWWGGVLLQPTEPFFLSKFAIFCSRAAARARGRYATQKNQGFLDVSGKCDDIRHISGIFRKSGLRICPAKFREIFKENIFVFSFVSYLNELLEI